jgi:hypothetical protein
MSVLFLFGLAIYLAWPEEEADKTKQTQEVSNHTFRPKPEREVTKNKPQNDKNVFIIETQVSMGGQ